MRRNLIFVRHGETDGNRDRQYIGRTDLPLNDNGLQQAEATGKALSRIPIHRVYYSPYQRTLQTAEIIMKHQPTLLTTGWHADPRLAELHFGRWEGLTFNRIEQTDKDLLWSWYDDPWNLSPPKGESVRDLDARLTEWVEAALGEARAADTQNFLIVTHGGPLRWLLAKYLHRDTTRFHNLTFAPGEHLICSCDGGGVWQLTQGGIPSP